MDKISLYSQSIYQNTHGIMFSDSDEGEVQESDIDHLKMDMERTILFTLRFAALSHTFYIEIC